MGTQTNVSATVASEFDAADVVPTEGPRALRARMLALRCQGCAARPGTTASRSEATLGDLRQCVRSGSPRDLVSGDLASDAAWFFCHKQVEGSAEEVRAAAYRDLRDHRATPLCAGFVAATYSPEDLEQILPNAERNRGAVDGFREYDFLTVALGGPGGSTCGHVHLTPEEAVACALALNSRIHAVVEIGYFDGWPTERNEDGQLERVDPVALPPYVAAKVLPVLQEAIAARDPASVPRGLLHQARGELDVDLKGKVHAYMATRPRGETWPLWQPIGRSTWSSGVFTTAKDAEIRSAQETGSMDRAQIRRLGAWPRLPSALEVEAMNAKHP